MKCPACAKEVPQLPFCDQCGARLVAVAGMTVVPKAQTSSEYELLREIGRGGMGVVYEALDKKLNKRVAIKKMREEIAINPKEKKRFLEEARRVAQLHHPDIVDIYRSYEEDGGVYLVFEYIDGEGLDVCLAREGRLPARRTARIGYAACRGLEHAHTKGIMHLDIKPANIMLGKDGFVKVMDFGIAQQANRTISQLTGTEASGSLPYMAPEQHLGKAEPRSDIYALGVTLYETVTGERPFPGLDYLSQKRELVHKKPSELVPDLSKELEAVVLDCLQCDADKRPQTAAALAGRLKLLR